MRIRRWEAIFYLNLLLPCLLNPSLYSLYIPCRFSDLSLCPLKWKIHVWWTKSLDGAEHRYADISSTRPVENAKDFSMEVWGNFFPIRSWMIIISVLLHLVFLFSHVIGESVRGIKSIVKARYFWSLKGEAKLGSSRLLCSYIVNSKLQRQIGIGSKTATLN